MKKGLYSFFWDCGRSGNLAGLFIATEQEVVNATGKRVYFGEVLGKHSEIYGNITDGDITLLSDDQVLVSKLQSVIPSSTLSGFNPLEYIEDVDEEEEES